MKTPIYLDYAATTPVDKEVLSAALPFYTQSFYNPSSSHALGQKAAAAVDFAREKCAAAINASPSEIYFTSGGTEAINWAMSGLPHNKKHVVVSAIEHDAVMACAKRFTENGCDVDFVKPDEHGIIRADALKSVLRESTGLVCVMTVNNIVGSIQPIKELALAAHEVGALFFTDAVQAVNSIDIDAKYTDVDMLAVSGHKFYAPKGIGLLYVKRGLSVKPFMVGGEQERGMRAGTVDVPSVVAMGVAIEMAQKNVQEYNAHASEVANAFTSLLKFGNVVQCENKTADIISIVFDGVNGGRLAIALSCSGVCCSVGSACSAGSATPPQTLIEMGVKNADCAVRFSFGKNTTVTSAKTAAQIVNTTVKRLMRV
ncbi:MAG: cysteine desulfurase [Clostridiales bacterium]|nr:cysteine desulfurase [Clostridiales bacterium]